MNYLAVETGFNVSGSLNINIAQFCVAASKSVINTTSVLYFFLPNAAYLQLPSLFVFFFYTSYMVFPLLLFVFWFAFAFFFVCSSLKSSAHILSMAWLYSFPLVIEIFLVGYKFQDVETIICA